MAFTGQTRDEIRDFILSTQSSQYASRGKTLDISPGSRAFIFASALAMVLESSEAQAEQIARDILPDQAGASALARHGYVDGVFRRAGVTARLTVTVSAASNTTFPIPAGTLMSYSDGTPYAVESASVTTSGGGHTGTITVRAVDAGAAGTRAVGNTLTFSVAPSGLNSTGTVASVVRAGTDEETAEDYAARIIARRRERPGSGNRADWRDWVTAYTATEIAEAYVYALLAPPASFPGAGTPDTPGTLTVVAVGPAQGESTTNLRIVPTDDSTTRTAGAELTRVEEYIEGTRLPDGTDVSATPNDPPRSVVLPEGNYCVQAINTTSQNVLLTIEVSDANAPQWSGTMTVNGASSSALVCAGDQTDKAGTYALVVVGTSHYRGGWKRVLLGGASYDTFKTTFTVTDADVQYVSAASTVYPAPGNWEAIRTAVLAYFDALGPGDTNPPSRWPTEDDEGRATVYRTALAAAAIGVAGVLSAVTTTPASDVVPDPKHVITLGTFRVTVT